MGSAVYFRTSIFKFILKAPQGRRISGVQADTTAHTNTPLLLWRYFEKSPSTYWGIRSVPENNETLNLSPYIRISRGVVIRSTRETPYRGNKKCCWGPCGRARAHRGGSNFVRIFRICILCCWGPCGRARAHRGDPTSFVFFVFVFCVAFV